jgi:hypothetical protein
MKAFGLSLCVAVFVYGGLCFLTWEFCPSALRATFVERAWREWEPARAWEKNELLKTNDLRVRRAFLTNYDMDTYRGGPQVKTVVRYCPAPLILRARCHMIIGSRSWCDADGWYCVTPWGIWTVWEHFDCRGRS